MAIVAMIRIRTSQTDLFEPGDVITGLTTDEEQELLDQGIAEESDVVEDTGNDDLSKLSKPDLLALAAEKGIAEVKPSMSKSEIIDLIKESKKP